MLPGLACIIPLQWCFLFPLIPIGLLMVLLWYFTCVHSRKRSEIPRPPNVSENCFDFFLKFQIWRSIKVWLRFIKQYWNWIKVRRSGHDNRQGGERLAANDLIIISPSGDGLDSSSGTDSPDRTGLDVDFSTWPCHNRQNCIQTPASNREEEGTYISYDKLVTSHSVTSFV